MDQTVMNDSCSQFKMASLEIPLELNNSSRSNISTYSSGDHEMGTSHKEGERTVLSDAEDVDIEIHLPCIEGFSDDNECMWLSSGSASTSFLSSDDLQSLDIFEIDFYDALLHVQSPTMLPVSRAHGFFLGVGNRSSIIDGPVEDFMEASPAPVNMEDAEDLNDSGNKVTDSFNGSMVSVVPLSGRSYCDDSSLHSNGCWPLVGMNDDPSPSQDQDFDRTDIWVSSLDLESEEAEWGKDGSDVLDPDFPSPSYRILRNIRIRSSNLSRNPSSKQLLDAQASVASPSSIFDLSFKRVSGIKSPRKDSDADEPLFWPFDWKSYWRPEFEGNYLGISPRASLLKIKRPIGRHAPKSVQFRLQNRTGSLLHRENIEPGYRGRILISSRSARSAPAGHKARDSNNPVSHASKVPSKLSRTTGSSPDKSESNISKNGGKRHPQLNSVKRKRGRNEKSSSVQYLLELEAGEFQIYLAGGIPIETLVGLDEFDGQEGIGKMRRAT
uniref:Chalcone--flavonone isomerase n=1 Tax=Anthurium amnicola TaxID=1678845 RepID=A0A1D1XYJ0_9ARAE